jgi:hypothetical protein
MLDSLKRTQLPASYFGANSKSLHAPSFVLEVLKLDLEIFLISSGIAKIHHYFLPSSPTINKDPENNNTSCLKTIFDSTIGIKYSTIKSICTLILEKFTI